MLLRPEVKIGAPLHLTPCPKIRDHFRHASTSTSILTAKTFCNSVPKHQLACALITHTRLTRRTQSRPPRIQRRPSLRPRHTNTPKQSVLHRPLEPKLGAGIMVMNQAVHVPR